MKPNREIPSRADSPQPIPESVQHKDESDQLAITRRSLAESDAGLVRPVEEMLAEMRRILDEPKSTP